jgi:methylmalonyl-CoA mutase cobalamin-binding subunit
MVTDSKSAELSAALPPRIDPGARSNRTSAAQRAIAQRTIAQPWAELLSQALATEIMPRPLSPPHRKRPRSPVAGDLAGTMSAAAVAQFVELLIADDIEQARAIADRVIVRTGSREALLAALMAPAARLLLRMQAQETADFVTVNLCTYWLDRIMRETAGNPARPANTCEYRVLLLPAPGEPQGFGLGRVADAFREGGWCVRAGLAVSRTQLLSLVADEWFDVIGFSVANGRWLNDFPACIRAMRMASCNPHAFVIAGGEAIANQPERARFLGIDATARDAQQALTQANFFMERTVTAGLCQSKSRTEFG